VCNNVSTLKDNQMSQYCALMVDFRIISMNIETQLALCTSIEEAHKVLSNTKMLKKDWLEVAKRNQLFTLKKTIKAIKEQLVLTLVGARLNSTAIRDTSVVITDNVHNIVTKAAITATIGDIVRCKYAENTFLAFSISTGKCLTAGNYGNLSLEPKLALQKVSNFLFTIKD